MRVGVVNQLGLFATLPFIIEQMHDGLSRPKRQECFCDETVSPIGDVPKYLVFRIEDIFELRPTTPADLHQYDIVGIDQAN